MNAPTVVAATRPAEMCAICLGSDDRPTKRVPLGYRVFVWLCDVHDSEAFRLRRDGLDFAAALKRLWLAGGQLRRQHHRAIEAHLQKVQRLLVARRHRHTSYHWPTLRDEMVARLGAGDSFDDIVADFERRHGNDVAQLPSMRTFRRWRDERSDLELPPSDTPVECAPERARSAKRPASPPARRHAATSLSAMTPGRGPLGRGDERRSTARPMPAAPHAARPPPRQG
jgi:hypothetical protein